VLPERLRLAFARCGASIGGGGAPACLPMLLVASLPILSSNNGYRFAKCEGESFVTIVEKCPRIAGFYDSAAQARQMAFRFDSSRCLNRDSNFTGHMIATSRQTANAYSAGLASRFCGIRASTTDAPTEP